MLDEILKQIPGSQAKELPPEKLVWTFEEIDRIASLLLLYNHKKISSVGGKSGFGASKVRHRTPEQMQAMRDAKKKKKELAE